MSCSYHCLALSNHKNSLKVVCDAEKLLSHKFQANGWSEKLLLKIVRKCSCLPPSFIVSQPMEFCTVAVLKLGSVVSEEACL